MAIRLVCSVCGSPNIERFRQRSMDDRWPLGICRDHHQKGSPWTPLIAEGSFRKRPRHSSTQPIDLFGQLPAEQQAELRKPIRLR